MRTGIDTAGEIMLSPFANSIALAKRFDPFGVDVKHLSPMKSCRREFGEQVIRKISRKDFVVGGPNAGNPFDEKSVGIATNVAQESVGVADETTFDADIDRPFVGDSFDNGGAFLEAVDGIHNKMPCILDDSQIVGAVLIGSQVDGQFLLPNVNFIEKFVPAESIGNMENVGFGFVESAHVGEFQPAKGNFGENNLGAVKMEEMKKLTG